MAGSERLKKPGPLFSKAVDDRARKRAVNAGGWVVPHKRHCPPDFATTAAQFHNVRHALCAHYRANVQAVIRWASETGVQLVRVSPEDMLRTRMSNAPAPDFDPIEDGDRWRLMQTAMTLNGRAVRGEVWRKEARGE